MNNIYRSISISLFFAFFVFIATVSQAQQDDTTKKRNAKIKAEQRWESMTPEERNAIREKMHSRTPKSTQKKRTQPYSPAKTAPTAVKSSSYQANKTQTESFADKVIPAEFEESQSVVMTWPAFAIDEEGEFIESFHQGLGWKMLEDGTDTLVPVAGYILELLNTQDSYAPIWREMANAIQEECEIWIRVPSIEDTTKVANYFRTNRKPLTRYKFLIDTAGVNSFWVRDYGPLGFYYDNGDKMGILDVTYYPDRPLDDSLPDLVARMLNVPILRTELEIEGGNFMTDGLGTGIYSDVIRENNADGAGPAYTNKRDWTPQETNDTLINAFNLRKALELPALQCDGGTGHIDIYTKFLDERTIAVAQYPAAFNSQDFPDFATLNANLNRLSRLKNSEGESFTIVRTPVPTDDNGRYNRVTCDDFNKDARTYVNGLLINKTYLLPVYSNTRTGNRNGDSTATALFKQLLPGYKVVPIDARNLTVEGGALHCITMQVPTLEPLTIRHKPLATQTLRDLNFTANIKHKSGIDSAWVYWRKKGSSAWQTLSAVASNSNNYNTVLSAQNLAEGDTIEYYIHSRAKSGKIYSKPNTAPAGYYSFSVMGTNTITDLAENAKITIVPSPAFEYITVKCPTNFSTMNYVVLDVYSSTGQLVLSTRYSPNTFIPISQLTAGVYCVQIRAEHIYSARFIKQ